MREVCTWLTMLYRPSAKASASSSAATPSGFRARKWRSGISAWSRTAAGNYLPHLADLEEPISLKVRKDKTKTKSIDVDSGDDVETSLRISASSDAPPLQGVAEGNAGLGLSFSKSGQFSLRVYGVLTDVMSNLASVERQMLERFSGPDDAERSWDPDWAVVTEVMSADRGLVAVASDSGAECTVDLGVKLGAVSVSLGDASAEASIAHKAHMASAYLFTEPTAIMYRARRLRTGIFHTPEVVAAMRRFDKIAGEGQVKLTQEWIPTR